MKIHGSVVLVTGASSGIGQAAALAFDRAGAQVAMAAPDKDRLEANAARMRGALVVPTDLAQESQATAMVDRTVEHFGRLDILINNAGVASLERSDTLDPAKVRRMLEVNFIGAMVAANRAVKTMRNQGGGIIINVTSPAAVMGVPYLASYCASKAAMRAWGRAVQSEWADSNITVCEYLPGLIQTEISSKLLPGRVPDGFFEQMMIQGPIGRILMRKPMSADRAGEHLVACAREPTLMSYSKPALGVFLLLGHVARSRYLMATRWARVIRTYLGLGMAGE